MKLSSRLRNKIDESTLTPSQRVLSRCQLAKEFEEAGEYEDAAGVLAEFWSGIGEAPTIEQLDESAKAEILLRAGALIGWLGSLKQFEDAQEKAKDLIGGSISIFGALGNIQRVAEAQTDLAYCYWRQGRFDEGRILLQDALSRLPDDERDVRSVVCLRMALLERCAGRYNDSIRILTEALPLLGDRGTSHGLQGKFHNTLALTLKNLGIAERREDYIDQALIEFTAASFHFEEAGHHRYWARVENNLGFLFSRIGRFDETHTHLDRARRLFSKLNDRGSVAQVDDTRARALLAEGRVSEAVAVARSAVTTLELSDELSLLAEALNTLGIALARIGDYEKSRSTLEKAFETAMHAGDTESAGVAALTTLEELCEQLKASEMVALYERAIELLNKSQDPSIPKRLFSCRDEVLSEVNTLLILGPADAGTDVTDRWATFAFREGTRRYERVFIKRALKDADGYPTRAAQLLGFKNYQSLISLINRQHPDLLPARSTVRPRGRGVLALHKSLREAATQATATITILHVEDNESVANLVREILIVEGWMVETCSDGQTALKLLAGSAVYDVLIFDYELPRLNGLELVRRVRKMSHRRRTPIVMLSASDCETEAWAARVDAFLRKPQDIAKVSSTITRLLRTDVQDE